MTRMSEPVWMNSARDASLFELLRIYMIDINEANAQLFRGNEVRCMRRETGRIGMLNRAVPAEAHKDLVWLRRFQVLCNKFVCRWPINVKSSIGVFHVFAVVRMKST